MAPQQLQDALRKKPFQPFRLVQTDGTGFEIRHAERLMVGICAVVVGIPEDPSQNLFDRTVTLDLLHVMRLEPLPAATSPNGQAGT